MKQRNWTMSQKEITRLEVINRYLCRRLNQTEAARQLAMSERHFRRLLRTFKHNGARGLVSRRRGRPSNRRISSSVQRQALELIHKHYSDFGPTFVHEKLWENHAHQLRQSFCIETLRHWMISAGLHQTKQRSLMPVHQSRPRRPRFGEMIQIDGSQHDWFEGRGPRCTLIAFIDDATSLVSAWFFYDAETTFNYMDCLRQHLNRFGRPLAIYSDRHSIFYNSKKEQHNLQQPSQFKRALKQLNIEPLAANSPQAKGRIERLFKTLQDRLVKEMRLLNICSIKQANHFLKNYRHQFNKRFSKKPLDSMDSHRPLSYSPQKLQLILSKQSTRKLSRNLICQYNNIQYLIKTKNPCYALRGARVTVYESEDGTIRLFYKDRELPYTIYQQQPSLGQPENTKTVNLAVDKLVVRRPKVCKPSPNHPWKRWDPESF